MSEKEKYPECEKLNEVDNVQSTLMQFTEWLQEQGYEIKHFKTRVTPLMSDLVYKHMNVDIKKLEEERRSILNYHLKANT